MNEYLLFVKMLLTSSLPSPPFSLSSRDAEHLKQLSRRLKLKTPHYKWKKFFFIKKIIKLNGHISLPLHSTNQFEFYLVQAIPSKHCIA